MCEVEPYQNRILGTLKDASEMPSLCSIHIIPGLETENRPKPPKKKPPGVVVFFEIKGT